MEGVSLSPPSPPTQPQVWQKAGTKYHMWMGPREWWPRHLTKNRVCFAGGIGAEWMVNRSVGERGASGTQL